MRKINFYYKDKMVVSVEKTDDIFLTNGNYTVINKAVPVLYDGQRVAKYDRIEVTNA